MNYSNIKKGKFVSRPNRFIANVEINNSVEVCHVKNTGRCKELLLPDANIYVEESDKPTRKTKFDLIAVEKNGTYINIDSSAPNAVFFEWISADNFIKDIIKIKPEYKYKNSRFDFYIETKTRKILAEIKGVTLEHEGTASFPDAPTLRGLKHINELIECIKDGFEAYIFFIVQMDCANVFQPNRLTQPEFADALIKAEKAGVNIYALSCNVTPDSIEISDFVKTNLNGGGYFG